MSRTYVAPDGNRHPVPNSVPNNATSVWAVEYPIEAMIAFRDTADGPRMYSSLKGGWVAFPDDMAFAFRDSLLIEHAGAVGLIEQIAQPDHSDSLGIGFQPEQDGMMRRVLILDEPFDPTQTNADVKFDDNGRILPQSKWSDQVEPEPVAVSTTDAMRSSVAKSTATMGVTLDGYQERAGVTSMHTEIGGDTVLYPVIGLLGEAGEIANKVKKIHRDQGGQYEQSDKDALLAELGDCLWYVSQIADELGATLEQVAIANLQKLESRKQRGKIGGSGDER